MKTAVYYPYCELGSLQREVDQFLNAVLRPADQHRACKSNVSIGEDTDAYYLEAVVPGIDPASIEIRVEDQVLRFSGNRAIPSETEGLRWHLNERPAGAFQEQFRLPANVAPDKISADYRHGVLTLTIPKVEAAKPRQIPVQVS